MQHRSPNGGLIQVANVNLVIAAAARYKLPAYTFNGPLLLLAD
jgi:hypothetical protein